MLGESDAHPTELIWAAVAVCALVVGAVSCLVALALARARRRARQEAAIAQARLQKALQDLDHTRKRVGELVVLARSAKALRNEFLSNISHEVRTPMNAIMGMTDLALATELTPKQRHYLERVHEAASSLLQLLNDLLDLAKIHARRFQLYPVIFQLHDCLSDVIEKFETRAMQKKLGLGFQMASNVPLTLVGDPGRLRQVVGALVSNAVKFTEQGKVAVLVETQEQAGEEVCLHIAVADTGPGIAEEKWALIFEAFRQADGSETRPYGGAGLGLAIASQMAETMGGRLWLESEVGKGSTFHFTGRFRLPREVPIPPAELDLSKLHGLKVLVAHADRTLREALEGMLAAQGMEPVSAHNSETALTALTKASEEGCPLPLVILDAAVPPANGFTLAEGILNDPGFAQPRIVVVTAAGKRGDAARCQQIGVSAYLTVPISREELAQALLMSMEEAPSQEPRSTLITKHRLRETHPGS